MTIGMGKPRVIIVGDKRDCVPLVRGYTLSKILPDADLYVVNGVDVLEMSTGPAPGVKAEVVAFVYDARSVSSLNKARKSLRATKGARVTLVDVSHGDDDTCHRDRALLEFIGGKHLDYTLNDAEKVEGLCAIAKAEKGETEIAEVVVALGEKRVVNELRGLLAPGAIVKRIHYDKGLDMGYYEDNVSRLVVAYDDITDEFLDAMTWVSGLRASKTVVRLSHDGWAQNEREGKGVAHGAGADFYDLSDADSGAVSEFIRRVTRGVSPGEPTPPLASPPTREVMKVVVSSSRLFRQLVGGKGGNSWVRVRGVGCNSRAYDVVFYLFKGDTPSLISPFSGVFVHDFSSSKTIPRFVKKISDRDSLPIGIFSVENDDDYMLLRGRVRGESMSFRKDIRVKVGGVLSRVMAIDGGSERGYIHDVITSPGRSEEER